MIVMKDDYMVKMAASSSEEVNVLGKKKRVYEPV
jgi:hypothetical protein